MVRAMILSLAVLSLITPAAQAETIWELVGDQQGFIGGGVSRPGEEGNIEIQSLSFGFNSSGSGGGSLPQISGSSIVLTKEWDSSSVNIAGALGNQELLNTCKFRIYGAAASIVPDGAGRRMPMGFEMQVELIGARLESHSVSGGDPYESVSIVYDEIRVTHEPTQDLFVWNSIGAPRVGSLSSTAWGSTGPALTGDPFEFVLPVTGAVAIDVADADGSPVRSLVHGDAFGPDGRIVWDATDDSGRPVEPGIYIATQRADGHEITRRIVVGH